MPSVPTLESAIAALAPADVRTGVRLIDADDLGDLRDAEARHVTQAVAKRRNEFATGRRLLRHLLATDAAIPVAPDRKPVFPAGAVGSLAHDAEVAVAAVAHTDSYRALGIDVEPAGSVDRAVADAILRPDEAELDPLLAFTLKEAVYKAWSMSGGPMLEHHDVRLRVERQSTADVIPFRGEVVTAGDVLTGSYCLADDRWLALVTIAR